MSISPRLRSSLMISLIAILALMLAACSSGAPAEEPAADEAADTAPAEEATEEPAEEETAPAEEDAAEEATEAEATEPPAEEEADEEATAAPEEEADEETADAEDATPAPEEEAADEAGDEMALMGDAAAGEYIVTITGGCGCHFNRDLGALAGGNEFEGPWGVAYASNITPDAETGIGEWTEQEIADALRLGIHPAHAHDGEEAGEAHQLIPAMPYMAFSALSDQEALAVAAYLLSQEPVANEVPAREITNEPAAYTPENEPPAEAPSDPVARGEQLATISRCGSCHTPTNEDGSPNMDLFLAGAPLRDTFSANITPDEETGIGSWTEEEIATFMQTGTFPDGSQVEGAMAQQIERRFSVLTDEDALAIAAYLMSIPAINHDPSAQ